MKPEDLAKSGTEHGHQVALFAWAALNILKYPELKLLFAIPNGGERNKIVAARLKAEGVKAGVSDLFLPVARKGYHGLFIEMKRKEIKVASKDQQEFGKNVVNQGFAFWVCSGWEAAKDCLIWYLS